MRGHPQFQLVQRAIVPDVICQFSMRVATLRGCAFALERESKQTLYLGPPVRLAGRWVVRQGGLDKVKLCP